MDDLFTLVKDSHEDYASVFRFYVIDETRGVINTSAVKFPCLYAAAEHVLNYANIHVGLVVALIDETKKLLVVAAIKKDQDYHFKEPLFVDFSAIVDQIYANEA